MSKFVMMVCLLVMLLVVSLPVMAQDVGDDAPIVVDGGNGDNAVRTDGDDALTIAVTNTLRDAVTQVVIVVAGAVGAVVLVLSGVVARLLGMALERIYMSVPSHYRPVVADFLDKATLDLVAKAKETDNPFDDVFMGKLRSVVEQVLAEHLAEAMRRNAEAMPNG